MKQGDKARPIWPRALGYFLAAILLLTLLSRAADSIMLPVVKLQRPLPGALKHTVMLEGVIEASEQWPMMAEPDLPVARVHVRAGQGVKAGEALLSYDVQALQRMLDEKQAALKKLTLQAQLDALEQSASDTAKDDIKKQDDSSAAEKRALKMQISRLEIELAQVSTDRLSQLLYGGATLSAPVDGAICEVLVKPGDKISGAALRLSPVSSGLIVRSAVTEDQKKHLHPGMEARFQRSGDARASEGVAVLKGISPTQSGYEAVFDLPDGGAAIGQSVSITVTQDTETYDMRVPLGAIVNRDGMEGVYRIRSGQSVLGEMEYAEFVTVSVVETDPQYAAIHAPLSDRDQVIASSSKPLRANDRVRSSS